MKELLSKIEIVLKREVDLIITKVVLNPSVEGLSMLRV